MFWASPRLNSMTCCSCSEEIFWKVSEKALPAFPAVKEKNLPRGMWFEHAIVFFLLVFLSPLLYSCIFFFLLFTLLVLLLSITSYSLSLLLYHSVLLSHLPNTPSPYPSSLQSASYPRRVAGSFPVST